MIAIRIAAIASFFLAVVTAAPHDYVYETDLCGPVGTTQCHPPAGYDVCTVYGWQFMPCPPGTMCVNIGGGAIACL